MYKNEQLSNQIQSYLVWGEGGGATCPHHLTRYTVFAFLWAAKGMGMGMGMGVGGALNPYPWMHQWWQGASHTHTHTHKQQQQQQQKWNMSSCGSGRWSIWYTTYGLKAQECISPGIWFLPKASMEKHVQFLGKCVHTQTDRQTDRQTHIYQRVSIRTH